MTPFPVFRFAFGVWRLASCVLCPPGWAGFWWTPLWAINKNIESLFSPLTQADIRKCTLTVYFPLFAFHLFFAARLFLLCFWPPSCVTVLFLGVDLTSIDKRSLLNPDGDLHRRWLMDNYDLCFLADLLHRMYHRMAFPWWPADRTLLTFGLLFFVFCLLSKLTQGSCHAFPLTTRPPYPIHAIGNDLNSIRIRIRIRLRLHFAFPFSEIVSAVPLPHLLISLPHHPTTPPPHLLTLPVFSLGLLALSALLHFPSLPRLRLPFLSSLPRCMNYDIPDMEKAGSMVDDLRSTSTHHILSILHLASPLLRDLVQIRSGSM